ncbi:hypothetical protein EPN95_00640 [Patescibacteria group bacterium]|nr:MAG: hypothetical protein EPN95_00640 [Patescibacteria group bacterium]
MITTIYPTGEAHKATTAELVFYSGDHKLNIHPNRLPEPVRYKEMVLVTFRPYRGKVNLILQLDTTAMIYDSEYRRIVRQLLGWNFGRAVRSAIKFQQKHGGKRYCPLGSAAQIQAAAKRIFAISEAAAERLVRASDVAPQLAVTTS